MAFFHSKKFGNSFKKKEESAPPQKKIGGELVGICVGGDSKGGVEGEYDHNTLYTK